MKIDTILIRLGELALKGKNRRLFEEQLRRNIRKSLHDLPDVSLKSTFGRLYVELHGTPVEEVTSRLKKVFGIISFSPSIRVENELSQIKEAALSILERTPQAKSFKVSARRTDRSFPLNSMEIPQHVGGYLLAHTSEKWVDVHHPDLEIKIEVRKEGTYVLGEVIPGAGGYPVGINGKVLLLLSGGIDSPVAGWYMLKRGVTVEAIHFHSFPFTSEQAKEKVISLVRILSVWGGKMRLHIVPFTEIQTEIRRTCPDDLLITIMRRYMMRIAERVADEMGAKALATGESLGQVASQTLDSLYTINQVAHLPILRPLIAMDKTEIIDQARRIGTYETSILPYEDCCTIFTPKSPRTKPKAKVVERVEEKSGMDMERLIRDAIRGMETLEIDVEKKEDEKSAEWF
ncbi:tRNA uracil 4-sulfurtransferase ThiI [Thermicanus aegyptius]|uniref:tRNA uracil 4-sulfurtransferase ThiI n=1 Tax=Thermicanus aegyptius TaxID=94009 RepID=UPI0004109AFE|nr:tRNA uracil 4-sulfurtransferase ThiI [Thermicanus aegyptius]